MIEPDRLTPAQTKAWRERQRGRALVTALVLGALAVLVFLIAVRKMAGA